MNTQEELNKVLHYIIYTTYIVYTLKSYDHMFF